MKNIILYTIAILGVSSINYASAACSPTLTRAQILSALNGNTLCIVDTPFNTQEELHTNGELWDYKTGVEEPTELVDPRKQIGTWGLVRRGARIFFTYDGGATYAFFVTDNGGDNYSFCQAGVEIANADVVSGVGGGCGF